MSEILIHKADFLNKQVKISWNNDLLKNVV